MLRSGLNTCPEHLLGALLGGSTPSLLAQSQGCLCASVAGNLEPLSFNRVYQPLNRVYPRSALMILFRLTVSGREMALSFATPPEQRSPERSACCFTIRGPAIPFAAEVGSREKPVRPE
jgi:hypothetical protein